jgi:pimeloyl-ACP methyl ester carboxylesterase
MFEATDGVALSGLLFEPAKRTRRALMFLHGTGGASIFDSRRTNLLAPEILARGIAWFPFNNRGSHVVRRLRKRTRSVAGGMAHELIRDCVHDIEGAVRELRRRGYRELYLAGHSTGANKVAVYASRKPRNPIRRYILLGGGDDTGLLYEHLGARRFRSAIETARAKIRGGDGDRFVPGSLSPLPMTWRAFYDQANPDGDYNVFPFLEIMRGIRLSRRRRFRHVRGIRKPTFAIYGERDEYFFGDVRRCVEILADAIGPKTNFEFAIMKDADHGFGGYERELGALMAEWLQGSRYRFRHRSAATMHNSTRAAIG